MAQMLQEKFSSEKNLMFVERHVHLSQRNPGAAFLVQDIQQPLKTLETSAAATEAKKRQRSFAYDAVIFYDGGLDNEVQNLFEACNKIDRETGTAPLLPRLFPTGRVSDIKEAPLMQEPLFVKQLIERLLALGAEHPLAEFIPVLQAKVAQSEQAIAAYDKLNEEIALLAAAEDVAQRKLRDQYRLNYLHALEKLGKRNAELLFPQIAPSSKPTEATPPAAS
jgi:hypothetical protein